MFITLGSPGNGDNNYDDDDDQVEGSERSSKPEFTLRWPRSSLDVVPPAIAFQKNFFPKVSKKAESFWQTIKPLPHVKFVIKLIFGLHSFSYK